MKYTFACMFLVLPMLICCGGAQEGQITTDTTAIEDTLAIVSPFDQVDSLLVEGSYSTALEVLGEISISDTTLVLQCSEYVALIDSMQMEILIQDSLAREEAIAEAASIIEIISLSTSRPNSADGVDLQIHWRNTSDKIIKYANFSVVPYNAVDDPVSCQIRRSRGTAIGSFTGPLNPGESAGGPGWGWECLWYNSTIVTAKIDQVEIEYMDGTFVTVEGDNLIY